MAKGGRWYQSARAGAVAWCVLVLVIIYEYQLELRELDAVPTATSRDTTSITEGEISLEDAVLRPPPKPYKQREIERRMERDMIWLKWLKMALFLFVVLVLLPLALSVIEKEEKQKSHSVVHLWKWVKSIYLPVTVMYCCVFVISFSSFFHEATTSTTPPTSSDSTADGEETPGSELDEAEEQHVGTGRGGALIFALLRWGLGFVMAAPFIVFTSLVAHLGYLRFTERSLASSRGKGLWKRLWAALMSPEEISRDLSMMGLPILAICTEVSLYGSNELLPGQQLLLLSSLLSLYISGFVLPVIASLIAKGAVCHTLQHFDKDNENIDADTTSGYISAASTGKACAAGIVICVPLTLLSAVLSTPVLRIQRSVILLLSTVRSWVTSLAAGGLGVLQFNLRRSLVMGDRYTQILFITSSISLLFIMALCLFYTDVGYFDSVNFDYLSSATHQGGETGEGYARRSNLVTFVDLTYVFGFSLTALLAFNRLKYL